MKFNLLLHKFLAIKVLLKSASLGTYTGQGRAHMLIAYVTNKPTPFSCAFSDDYKQCRLFGLHHCHSHH